MHRSFPHKVLISFLFLSYAFAAIGQDSKILRLDRINFSSNTNSKNGEVPSYANFVEGFRFGNGFTVQPTNTYSELETNATSSYAGFNINFIFKSNLFDDSTTNSRRLFSFSAEAGTINNRLFDLQTSDNRQFRINYRAEVFRLAVGYRHVLTKKNRRVKFYTGIELVNEFNISSTIRENEYNEGFSGLINERKFFAVKGFGLYLNSPLGINYRPGKKTRFFLHLNFSLGTQNADPFRINGLFTGARLGVSFKV